MNVNIYLEDKLAQELNQYAKEMGETRNALIRAAIREWLAAHRTHQWPHAVQSFEGVKNFPEFESYREELQEPKEDPFS